MVGILSKQTPAQYADYLASYMSCPSTIRARVLDEYGRAPKVEHIRQFREKHEQERAFQPRLQKGASYNAANDDGRPFRMRGLVPQIKPVEVRQVVEVLPPVPTPVEVKAERIAGPVELRVGNGRAIMQAVADSFEITIANLVGPDRRPKFVSARAVAAKLLRDILNADGQPHYSFPMIGNMIGGRDHSTIIHAVRTFHDRARKYPAMLAVYDAMRGGGMTDARTIIGLIRPCEAAVLDRWDDGQTIEQITAATGFKKDTVENVLSRFDGGGEALLHTASMREGSDRLLAAIQRSRLHAAKRMGGNGPSSLSPNGSQPVSELPPSERNAA